MKGDSMTIKELHTALCELVPESGFTVLEHSLRDYPSGDCEAWGVQYYEDNISRLESLLAVYNAAAPDVLIEQVKTEYAKIRPDERKAKRIQELKNRLAELENA